MANNDLGSETIEFLTMPTKHYEIHMEQLTVQFWNRNGHLIRLKWPKFNWIYLISIEDAHII